MKPLILFFSLIYCDTLGCKDNEIFVKKSKESYCNGQHDNQIKDRCICKDSKIRSEKNGECLSIEECRFWLSDESGGRLRQLDSEEKDCGVGGFWNACASACEPTCQNPNSGGSRFSACNFMCISKCSCEDGYTWDEKAEKCVKKCPTEEKDPVIPDCPVGSSWNECGSECEETCQTPRPDICSRVCVKKCTCDKGYIMDEISGKCVKVCPKPKCPANQIWKDCPLCSHICGEAQMCMAIAPCEEGSNCPCPVDGKCVCKDGFQTDPLDPDKCISEKVCKQCAFNEIFNQCAASCENTCQNPTAALNCNKKCESRCQCKDGYIRDEVTKRCISKKECKKITDPVDPKTPDCGVGGVWDECGSPCDKTCQSPGSDICADVCVPKCRCGK